MSQIQQGFLTAEPAVAYSEATELMHSGSVRKYRPIEHIIRFPCESGEYPVAFVRDCVVTVSRGKLYWASIYSPQQKHLLPYLDTDTITGIMPLSHDIVVHYLSGRLIVLNTGTFALSKHFLEDRDDALVAEHGVFVDNGQLCTFDMSAESKIRRLGIKVKSPSYLAVSAAVDEEDESWYYDLASNSVKKNKWSFPIMLQGCKSYVASSDGGVVWRIKNTTIGIHTLQLDGSFSEEMVVQYPWDSVSLVGVQHDNAIIATRHIASKTSNIMIMNRSGEVLKTYPLDYSNAPSFVKPYGLINFTKNGVNLNTLIC